MTDLGKAFKVAAQSTRVRFNFAAPGAVAATSKCAAPMTLALAIPAVPVTVKFSGATAWARVIARVRVRARQGVWIGSRPVAATPMACSSARSFYLLCLRRKSRANYRS